VTRASAHAARAPPADRPEGASGRRSPPCDLRRPLGGHGDRAIVAFRASPARLEDAIRCTCGSRRGRLRIVTSEASPTPTPGAHRCYLFHVWGPAWSSPDASGISSDAKPAWRATSSTSWSAPALADGS